MRTVEVRVVATAVAALILGLLAVPLGPASGAEPNPSAAPSEDDTLTLSTESRTAIVPEDDVERLAGVDRIATAVAVSRRAFPDGADAVVLATAHSFPDALTAAPLAYRGAGPLLLVGQRLAPEVADEIRRLRATTVYVPGAIHAVPYVVEVELRRMGLEVVRLAGTNRFDTAGVIAAELGPGPSDEVAVASGLTFADALSFGPLAAAAGIPILLVAPDRLPGETDAALGALEPGRTIVLGGPHAVSDDVFDALPSPVRHAGPDRYGTATAIAEHLLERGGTGQVAYVATGWAFPDALSAGPVAALGPGPLLLVHGQDPQAAEPTWRWFDGHDADVDGIVVFGGPHAVEPEVVDRLRPYVEGSP